MKRRALIAGVAAMGVAVAAGLYRFTDLFVKHYPPTPYDDVLNEVVDREQAARLGRAVLVTLPHQLENRSVEDHANYARTLLGHGNLEAAASRDAKTGQVIEADGWMVPLTIVVVSTLVARLQRE